MHYKIDAVCTFLVTNLDDLLIQPPTNLLCRQPHFLMLFAAVSHGLVGIPQGQMNEAMPERGEQFFSDQGQTKENLRTIAQLVNVEIELPSFEDFVLASSATTQRISSRRVRFPLYWKAFLPTPLVG